MRQLKELIGQLPQACNMAIINPKGSQCVCCARDEAFDYLHMSIVAIPSLDILHEGQSAKLQTVVGYRCLGKSGPAPKSEINTAHTGLLRQSHKQQRYYMSAFVFMFALGGVFEAGREWGPGRRSGGSRRGGRLVGSLPAVAGSVGNEGVWSRMSSRGVVVVIRYVCKCEWEGAHVEYIALSRIAGPGGSRCARSRF